SSRRRHTRWPRDWSSDVCSSDLTGLAGIQRGFLLERENDCLAGLLTAPVDPADIYAGKLAANVVLLGATQAVVVPLTGLFLHADLWPVLPGLLAVLLLGNVGFAALATLFAAVAARTRARETLLPLLLLPLALPLLIGAVQATQAVLAGGRARGGGGRAGAGRRPGRSRAAGGGAPVCAR